MFKIMKNLSLATGPGESFSWGRIQWIKFSRDLEDAGKPTSSKDSIYMEMFTLSNSGCAFSICPVLPLSEA